MTRLNWAGSRTTDGVSEIAVLAPIRRGTPPGERRTYEERARQMIASISERHAQGLPTGLGMVQAIHFGRFIIIRPEQYLLYSVLPDIDYEEAGHCRTNAKPPKRPKVASVDEFREIDNDLNCTPALVASSWLLTLVEFDGDLRGYMRDVALGFSDDFDMLFQNCEEYPGTQDVERWWLWIRRFQIATELLYAPYGGLSVTRLKNLERFKTRFDAFVARVRSPTGSRVRDLNDLFDAFLRENGQIAGGFPSPGGRFPAPADGEDLA